MKILILKVFFIVGIFTCYSFNNEKSGLDIETNKNNNPLEYRLLFIGNSLTYANDLPNIVKSIAQDDGKTITVTVVAKGNYALVDHWNDGVIQTYIESGDYDFVIVQQGPSSQPNGRGLLIEYGTKISELCKSSNAQLAYYMVWPSLTYYSTFEGVMNSYTEAANINEDILCPVGEVWKSYFDETNDFSYYGTDGFHPSIAGSNVAAKIIYESLFSE